MSWKKHGSPYDPNYQGKAMRPQEKAERERQEREREQHQLRGCGEPGCPMCNPETAAAGRGRRTSSFQPYATVDVRSVDFSTLRDAMEGMSSRLYEEAMRGYARTAAPSGPPASYIGAREKVKDWIVPAPAQAFDDIVGNEAALEQLRDAIQAPVKHKALYEAYGMKMPKGAMLSGPPGCGKTMFARAAAAEMKRLYGDAAEFVSVSGADLQSMFIGETEARIKAIFVFAREYLAYRGHPLLVFMDEAEVLLPDRTGRIRRVASWEESQVATFLAEMDGMQASGAFVLLATNRPEVIDQAVLRDGRCDFKIVVQRPTAEAVEAIVRTNFAGAPIAEDAKLEDLVFAAVESLYDPHKIILYAHTLRMQFGGGEAPKVEHTEKHFLLEHIVSGAIAASIPGRAKRFAFTRDKADGIARGITVNDVVQAVNAVFEENRTLDHAFALNEFRREFMAETGGGGDIMITPADLAARGASLHATLAHSHPALERGQVWCRSCGSSLRADAAQCLRNGWPRCCGVTMTIDAPEDRPAAIAPSPKGISQ